MFYFKNLPGSTISASQVLSRVLLAEDRNLAAEASLRQRLVMCLCSELQEQKIFTSSPVGGTKTVL